MAWQLELTDLAGETSVEVRDAKSKKLRFPLDRMPTIGGQVRIDNPVAPRIFDLDKTLLKGYENKVLKFIGPIVSYEKSRGRDSDSIAFTAAGAEWRLGHRLLGKTVEGFTLGTALALQDRGAIAVAMLAAANADGDTGIRPGTLLPSASSYVKDLRYVPVNQAISDLSAPLDGFDFEYFPQEPEADGDGVAIAELNIAPAIGTTRLSQLWEFGTGRNNVESMRVLGDANGLANRATHLPPGYPDNPTQGAITSEDPDSIADRGLHEAIIAQDLTVDALRTKLVQENVRIRKQPRLTVEFTPITQDDFDPTERRRVPRAMVDYYPGDVVPFRATERFRKVDAEGRLSDYEKVKTIDTLMRIYAIDISIDDNSGVATATPTLVEEAS